MSAARGAEPHVTVTAGSPSATPTDTVAVEASSASARAFRPDIQGLRAVAVTLVVVYHLWPHRLSGGFIGVDVFFVISGYLITSHLWSRPPRSGHDLATFWARRVRRLLPASLLVLAVTTVASRLVAPDTQWAATARQVAASALYVQNWALARSSVDYLAAENAASPVQHFWSLSVEEQFYAVWPVLVLLLVALATRRGWHSRTVVASGLAVVVLASLAYSVHATATEPASAYFITTTRIWELGVGGLLGVLVAGRAAGNGRLTSAQPARAALAWAGFAAIGWTAVTYTAATPFPGWRAVVPVLGTVAVIAASDPGGRFAPGRVLGRRPVQFLGDASYSIYLWHWPLIVLLPYVSGGQLGWLDKATVLVATLILSWASKVHVEDRFRDAPRGAPVRSSFLLGAAGMVLVLLLAGLQIAESTRREDAALRELSSALAGEAPCFGAAASPAAGGECAPSIGGVVIPAPAQAATDKSEAYDQNCFEPAPFDGVRRCTFGDATGTVSLALVGNSHMGHWLPAIDTIADRQGWRVTTFLSSECTASKTPVTWDADAKQIGCLAWADEVLRETATGDFDLVVTSERNGRPAVGLAYEDSYPAWLEGYRGAVAEWVQGGSNVLVIHDTATPGATLRSVPDCLAEHPDDFTACAGPRSAWVPRDPLVQAAEEANNPNITTVDLNDYLCDAQTCPAVIGGVVVYFDASHLTATYSTTLAPYLAPSLTSAVRRALVE